MLIHFGFYYYNALEVKVLLTRNQQVLQGNYKWFSTFELLNLCKMYAQF